MESTEERILHYQRGIDRSVLVLDKSRLLHCIKALSKLPVTMRHLKSTGIGRTVNSLRKIEDGVGDASKRLVTKWKEMVSNAPDSGESDEACVPDDPDNYESVNCDQGNSSPPDNNTVEDNYSDGYNGINRPEALDRPALSPPMVIDVNISPEEPVPNLSDEDNEPEETNYNQSSKNSSSKDKESKKDSKSSNSSRHSNSKDKRESSKVSKNSKDNGHEEQHKKKDNERDRSKSKSESSSSKDKKYSSDVKKRKAESSDEESNRKKQRLSVCENESDNDEEPNNFVIDNDIDEEEDQESLSNERDSEVKESSKDRHKESSLKVSDKSSSSSSSSKSKDKRSSSSSSSSKAKSSSSHELKKDKEERSKKDDKHKSKSSHSSSSSSSKVHNGKDKEKYSKGDDREKSKNDEKGKVKDKKEKEHKKSKEHKEKKKSKTTVDGSIDSMSGTSFADALGMCSMPPPKKKKDSSSKTNSKAESPQPSPTKPSPSKSKTEPKPPSSPTPDSPEDSLAMLAPNVKLEPLSNDLNEEVDLASTLPEPSPFYKPLPQVNHVQRRVDEEAMLSQVINAKVQRTKVYSGNKSGWTSVPTLQEICIRVLIENIDALEYTGGVPFDILKPVLERASADQLFMLEYHNPYLVEESDQLWKFHCNKYFKNKQREEMESWREMYMRCLTEREAKFKAITANIKQSIDKSTPVRSTKLAYVDHFVKPPRNVLRQQAKYGTARVTTSASDLKKKLITGVAGPSSTGNSSNSGSSSSNVERISVPLPPPSRSRAPSSHPIKKPKAPLMAKALQAIKGRYKR